jgi:hypothetical protein
MPWHVLGFSWFKWRASARPGAGVDPLAGTFG